jgi:hypothetical protein
MLVNVEIDRPKSGVVKDKFAAKTNLAVSSTEFCQCTFDKY